MIRIYALTVVCVFQLCSNYLDELLKSYFIRFGFSVITPPRGITLQSFKKDI